MNYFSLKMITSIRLRWRIVSPMMNWWCAVQVWHSHKPVCIGKMYHEKCTVYWCRTYWFHTFYKNAIVETINDTPWIISVSFYCALRLLNHSLSHSTSFIRCTVWNQQMCDRVGDTRCHTVHTFIGSTIFMSFYLLTSFADI